MNSRQNARSIVIPRKQTIRNIKDLLYKYGSIPLENLIQVYYLEYNLILDPERDFGTKSGLASIASILERKGIAVSYEDKWTLIMN